MSTAKPTPTVGVTNVCACGHTRRWHADTPPDHAGRGECEHNSDCRCTRFTSREGLQWEPGSLPTVVLARVLIDALADVWNGSARPEEFREQLEHAAECATGIPLAGLPSAASSDAQLDAATQRFHATYRTAYSESIRSTEPEQAHDEAVQEAIEAALVPRRRRSLHEGAHHHGGKYFEDPATF